MVGGQVGLLEGLAALAVQQRQVGGLPHVFGVDLGPVLVSGDGRGGLIHHDVAAHPVHVVLCADGSYQLKNVVADYYIGQEILTAQDSGPLFFLGTLPQGHEHLGIGLIGDAAFDHFLSFFEGEPAIHLHGQAKAVQQLGPQVTFLWVHRAHQDEL